MAQQMLDRGSRHKHELTIWLVRERRGLQQDRLEWEWRKGKGFHLDTRIPEDTLNTIQVLLRHRAAPSRRLGPS